MAERNKKVDDLQQTYSVLQSNMPKVVKEEAAGSRTKATMAFSLLGDLIDECIHDVLFDAHRALKQSSSICQICQTKCRSY
ncbi:hypothetical protein DFQ30_010290, partial [Apophysomyces sp. BC1015]